jgi:hypothetical protein
VSFSRKLCKNLLIASLAHSFSEQVDFYLPQYSNKLETLIQILLEEAHANRQTAILERQFPIVLRR